MISQFPESQTSRAESIEDEISRILEFTAPIVDERPGRKGPSQSEAQGTYLSRSRSFLAETTESQGSMRYSGLDNLWPAQEEKPDVVEEEELDPGVKSWHELKRGGEDKRLRDEMEDLIEECKVGGRIGLRRSSVLQIVDKLLKDVNWRKKLKALGLMSSFVQNVADAHVDPVIQFCDLAYRRLYLR